MGKGGTLSAARSGPPEQNRVSIWSVQATRISKGRPLLLEVRRRLLAVQYFWPPRALKGVLNPEKIQGPGRMVVQHLESQRSGLGRGCVSLTETRQRFPSVCFVRHRPSVVTRKPSHGLSVR